MSDVRVPRAIPQPRAKFMCFFVAVKFLLEHKVAVLICKNCGIGIVHDFSSVSGLDGLAGVTFGYQLVKTLTELLDGLAVE